MKKEQIEMVLRLTPVVYAGTFIRSTKHGMGVTEMFKGFAKELWNQSLVYIDCTQSNIDEVALMLEKSDKSTPVVYFIDSIEKANDDFRRFLFRTFSINRDECINNDSRVFYHINHTEDYLYTDNWDDWVMVHSVHYNVEE